MTDTFDFTAAQIKKAYAKAKAFFRANPKKWGKHRMHSGNGCMCMSGRMAYELGYDPIRNPSEFSSAGWGVTDSFSELRNGPGIITYNDNAHSVEDVIARLDPIMEKLAD